MESALKLGTSWLFYILTEGRSYRYRNGGASFADLCIEILYCIRKATPPAGQLTFSLSSDKPIIVEYEIENMGYMRFYLAPKNEEEEVTGPQVEIVPKVDTKTKADVKHKVERKPKMEIKPSEVIEIEEGNEVKVETKPKLEKIEIDDESEPKVETKPKTDIKPKEETEIYETKPPVEDKAEVEVMDVEG